MNNIKKLQIAQNAWNMGAQVEIKSKKIHLLILPKKISGWDKFNIVENKNLAIELSANNCKTIEILPDTFKVIII